MKKAKKLTALITLLGILFSFGVQAAVSDENLLSNGDFSVADETTISKWGLSKDNTIGTYTKVITESKNTYVAFSADENVRYPYISQTLTKIVRGADYSLTFRFKCESNDAPRVTIEQKGKTTGDYYKQLNYTNKELDAPGSNGWVPYTIDFTLDNDENLKTVTVMLRGNVNASAPLCYDDAVLNCKSDISLMEVKNPPIVYPYETPAQGAENLIKNPGFESVTSGAPTDGWSAYQTAWENNDFISLDEKEVHSGKYSVKIETVSSNNPWIRQTVPVEEYATYQASTWVNPCYGGAEKGFAYKFEFYTEATGGANASLPSYTSDYFQYANEGEWSQFNTTFFVPKGARYVTIYFRLFTNGAMYIDDVEVKKVKDADKIFMETDEIFYYSDGDKGYATATVNGDTIVTAADFELLDGDKVLAKADKTPFKNGTADYAFKLSLLDKQKPYIVRGTFYNGNEVVSTKEERIYKYDRPSVYTKDGKYMVDGKEFTPVLGYHARETEDYPEMLKAGINVAQSWTTTDLDYMQTMLDEAQKNGIMVLLTLYKNMLPAGHPLRAELTKNAVERFKDHPALFGYAVMDEPLATKETGDAKEWLENSYKIIRDIDTKHPVYICQCPCYDKGRIETYYFYNDARKYSDCIGLDSYPAGVYKSTTFVHDEIQHCYDVSSYNKPVYTVLQVFDWKGNTPTLNEVRSGIYQSLFGGADGIGYYALKDSVGGLPMIQTPYWNTLTAFAKEEQENAFAMFIDNKYPTINEVKNDAYMYRAFLKDGKVYAYVFNCSDTEALETEIPLTFFDGTAAVSSYTYANGSGKDKLSVSLEAAGTAVYILTPGTPVDADKAVACKFKDLRDYPWARREIETMYKKGALNSTAALSFAPGVSVTRGDFAMFLINTLGLTASAGENFADIDPDAEYANAVAVGKALGVLKGTDGVNYNPEEKISRQDLMVICARGMRLKKALQDGEALTSFSDSEAVASYAVADIASIVRANIVKGNVDGTINPLGNTTRAEAAVIMYRIDSWIADA